MESVAKEKERRAFGAWRSWRRWNNNDGAAAQWRADKALDELLNICADEVAEGFGGVGADYTVLGSQETYVIVARSAVLEAAQTLQDEPGRSLLRHVSACATQAWKNAATEQRERIRQFSAEQSLRIATAWSHDVAAFVLDRLTFDQRNDLLELAGKRTGLDRLEIRLGDEAPQDPLKWTLWYTARLHAFEPEVVEAFADKATPTHFLLNTHNVTRKPPRNKAGAKIDLAGPIHVKVAEVLAGLPENAIPATVSRNVKMGLALGVHRDVIRRWKMHPEWDSLTVHFRKDGKGGVYHSVDLENVLRSARIVSGHKRGPKAPR